MKRIIYSIGMVLLFFVFVSCSESSNDPEEDLEENPTVSEITVMSFNIRNSGSDTDENQWSNRKAACLSMINDVQPAIIGMQEVRPDQKTYFDDNLENFIIVGTARDGSSSSTEYSSVCFRSDIFTMLDSGTFWLSDTPDFMSKGWDGACYRICTWVKLKVKSTGKEIFFFNTHLDHKGAEAQEKGLLLIKERIKKIAGDNANIILTGDFNMKPGNANIVSFGTFMESIRDQYKNGEFYYTDTFNGWGSSYSIIDFVWYQNLLPVSYNVLTGKYLGVTYISDHYPITGNFKIP